jgi:DNA polymerase-3 subunit chi
MPQVDFYILHTRNKAVIERFICQLTDKIWQQGYRLIDLYLLSQADAQNMDQILWTFKPDSFLPHDVYPDVLDSLAPIRIIYPSDQLNEAHSVFADREVLINGVDKIPSFFSYFKRIAECVIDTPQARETGRHRYRFYRDGGNALKIHDIYL